MAHRGPRPDADPRVCEGGRDPALRREWLVAEIPRADVVEQVLAGDERLFTRTPTRAFTIAGHAQALLIGDGAVQMVEDVYTTPAHRGRGLASALVRTALAHATAGLVFLPTAHGGPAQRLYRRLGFEDLHRSTLFWREVSG